MLNTGNKSYKNYFQYAGFRLTELINENPLSLTIILLTLSLAIVLSKLFIVVSAVCGTDLGWWVAKMIDEGADHTHTRKKDIIFIWFKVLFEVQQPFIGAL